MNQGTITDVIGLFVLISTAIFSAEVSAIIGPYMAIVVAAAIGASFSLAKREKTTRVSALWFFLRVCGLAVVVAGGLSALLAKFHPVLTERALLAPVAFIIGLVGDEWSSVVRWGVDFFRDFVFRKRGDER